MDCKEILVMCGSVLNMFNKNWIFRHKIICLCYVMKNVNKSLFYVGSILKVISCLDYANVLLCNYVGIQVMILQKD